MRSRGGTCAVSVSMGPPKFLLFPLDRVLPVSNLYLVLPVSNTRGVKSHALCGQEQEMTSEKMTSKKMTSNRMISRLFSLPLRALVVAAFLPPASALGAELV